MNEMDDADLLRAIKRGEWTLDDVKVLAEKLFADVKVARDTSALPEEPDYPRINTLVTEITLNALE